MTNHRTLREKLVPDFLEELERPNFKSEPHPGSDREPRLVHALVQNASDAGASDIHIEPRSANATVRFRIDGVIADVANITTSQSKVVINQFKAVANLDPVAIFIPKDAHARSVTKTGPLDLRLALTPSESGEALVVRLLDHKRLQRSIDDLGLATDDLRLLEGWIENGAGMFLAAGPTGCGKTTTVYSLLHEFKSADRAIVTLEDPVEYQIDGIVQVQLDQRHHLNFGEGIKQMLRLDPDFLMLGEIRDAASARAAVDAAISGRALLSTLHCRDAVGAVTALRNWGLYDHEIAEALSVVVGQRLVRRLCAHCRRTRHLTQKELHWFSAVGLPAPKQVTDAAGCGKCGHIGYSGRTGIFELWRLNEADYEAILKHGDEHALRRANAERQPRSILADGLAKVLGGITSVSELQRASSGFFPSQTLVPARSKRPGRNSRNRLPVPSGT